MKKIVALIAILLYSTFFSQTTLVENAINFAQVKELKEKKDAKELTKEGITQYTASNGTIVKIGDKFRINRPEGGTKTFISITNKPTVMDGFGGTFNPTVGASMSNTEIAIKKIYIAGSKKYGFQTFAELETCGTCNNLLVDIELAIETKEIKTDGMTREEAIKKLKEAKDLLDLDMMKKEEYESLKEKLAPIIKSN